MGQKEIETIIDALILEFPIQSKLYNQGKTCLGFFVGQCLKKTKGYGSVIEIQEIVVQKLSQVKI